MINQIKAAVYLINPGNKREYFVVDPTAEQDLRAWRILWGLCRAGAPPTLPTLTWTSTTLTESGSVVLFATCSAAQTRHWCPTVVPGEGRIVLFWGSVVLHYNGSVVLVY